MIRGKLDSGAVVVVSEATAARLGRNFTPDETPAKNEPVTEDPKPKPRGRTVRKP